MNNLRTAVVNVEVGEIGRNFLLKNWPVVLIATPMGMATKGLIIAAMMIERVIEASLLTAIKNKQTM